MTIRAGILIKILISVSLLLRPFPGDNRCSVAAARVGTTLVGSHHKFSSWSGVAYARLNQASSHKGVEVHETTVFHPVIGLTPLI